MVISRIVSTLSRPLVWLVFRPDVHGAARIPDGGCVVSANHLSGFDSWALTYVAPSRPLRSMGKSDLFRSPVLAPIIRSLGVFPARDVGALAGGVPTAVALATAGEPVAIFPEGARRRGTVRRPRHGAARTALLAGVPLVPVAIAGTDGWRDLVRWRISVGDPILLDDLREQDPESAVREATRRLWHEIRTLEAELASAEVAAARRGDAPGKNRTCASPGDCSPLGVRCV
jgi:1-acyl-sn-glycerol-3-phosphate acyltransferase